MTHCSPAPSMNSTTTTFIQAMALDSLPAELFMEIIACVAGSESHVEEAMFGGDDARLSIETIPFRFSSVCRRWRERILAMPRAWQRIYLSFSRERLLHADSAAKQTRYLELVLSRARAVPLYVYVGGAPGTVQDYHSSILSVLQSILPRVQRLSMWTAMETVTPRSIFEQLTSSTPLLQYLSVGSDEFAKGDPEFTKIPFFYDSPELVEMRLCNLPLYFIDCVRFPNLRSLTLSACDFNSNILGHVGHWWPRLEHLSLQASSAHCRWPTIPPTVRHMPIGSLRSLDLHSCGMAPMLGGPYARRKFIAPTLSQQDTLKCMLDFFHHSVRSLEELTLRDTYVSPRIINDILVSCKLLRRLHLHDSTCGEDFWSAWTSTPSAAPVLHDLALSECRFPGDAGSAFVAFLQERRPGATTSSRDTSCARIDTLRVAQIPKGQAHTLTPHVVELVRAVIPGAVIGDMEYF